MRSSRPAPCLPVALCALHLMLASRVAAHGLMSDPPQRGILSGNQYAPSLTPIDGAPTDFFAHFPAGDKSTTPGAGKNSQERAAGRQWTPFDPFNPSFNWRAGVCGDARGGVQEHLKGGRYYFDGYIVRTYPQGGFVHMTNAITAHHNGFVEVHVCDVSKCPGGDISERCFSHTDACIQLQRTPMPECDSGMSQHCAPIDRNYRGRWYLPCSTGARFDEYGGDSMVWSLPSHLYCSHCVLHWYWVSANTCNPPGVKEYFEGPDAPRNWGSCRGQGGAIGGYAKNQFDCGGDIFPEEYHQCADIRIERIDGGRSVPRTDAQVQAESDDAREGDDVVVGAATVTPTPSAAAVVSAEQLVDDAAVDAPQSPFVHIAVIADGQLVAEVLAGDDKAVDVSAYDKVSLEAVTTRSLGKVYFAVNGKKVWMERSRPYFIFGNRGRTPNYWDEAILNEEFDLKVSSGDDEIEVKITLIHAEG